VKSISTNQMLKTDRNESFDIATTDGLHASSAVCFSFLKKDLQISTDLKNNTTKDYCHIAFFIVSIQKSIGKFKSLVK